MKLFSRLMIIITSIIIGACSSNISPSRNNTQIYVLDCGTIVVKDISLFSPGVNEGQSKTLSNACYLIKHDKGILLWDTGLGDDLVKSKDGVFISEGMFHLKARRSLVSQLNEIGLQPENVDFVAISHFHFDHTGNMNLFKQSKILTQKNELDIAFSDNAEEMYFAPNTYDKLSKGNFIGLDGSMDVFNDGRVVIIPSPGHTPGHQSLLVNLNNFGPVVLSGDLYHFNENRVHKRIPALNVDKALTLKSIDQIERKLSDINGTLWIQHDLDIFQGLKLSPEFYH